VESRPHGFPLLQDNQRQEITRDAKQLDEALRVVQKRRDIAREFTASWGSLPQLRV